MPLIRHLAQFPDSYDAYYEMLHEDMIELFSPCQGDKNHIQSNLYYRIVETLAAHEGLFPFTENSNVAHQIIDIVQHIPLAGPIQSFWTLAGERAVCSVKNHVIKGGSSYEIPSIISFNRMEEIIFRKSYDFTLSEIAILGEKTKSIYSKHHFSQYLDKIMYDPFKIMVFKPILLKNKRTSMESNDESNAFLKAILLEVQKRCLNHEDALYRSGFYRLYCSYKFQKNEGLCRMWSFSDWVTHFYNYLHDSNYLSKLEDENEGISVENLQNVIKFIILNNPSTNLQQSEGYIRKQDIPLFTEIFNMLIFKVTLFSKAIIFGEKFSGRGFEYRESQSSIEQSRIRTKIPTNPHNVLKCNWWKKIQYSSWIKFRVKSYNNTDDFGWRVQHNQKEVLLYDLVKYGQLNFCFYLQLPSDEVLNGICFANITGRRVNYTSKGNVPILFCDDLKSYDDTQRYIPLTNIFSTQIMIIPLDEEKRPYPHNYIKSNDISFRSTQKFDQIHSLMLIELNPSRSNIMFDESTQEEEESI